MQHFQIKSQADVTRGAAIGLLAAVLFGVSTPLSKLLLNEISPQLLAGLLYLSSGVGLTILAKLKQSRFAKLTGSERSTLLLAILFGGVLGPTLLFLGLSRSTAAATSLLLNLEGVLTAVLAWVVFGESFNRRIGLGMALIALGAVVLTWQGTPQFDQLLGPLLVCAACLAWALDNNFTRKIAACDALQIASLKGLVAGAFNTTLALALGATLPGATQLAACAVLGFFSYGLSLVAFVVALRLIGSARTGAYFSTAPFLGAVLALLFGEEPSAAFMASSVLMGIGVYLHITESVRSTSETESETG